MKFPRRFKLRASQRGFIINPYRFGSAPPASAVSFVAAAKGDNSSGGGTNFTITIPTVATGDFLVVSAIDRSGSGADKPSISDNDSGTWSVESEVAPSAGGYSMLWSRVATGATSAKTITIGSLAATACGSAVLMVYRNVNTASSLTVLRSLGLASGTNTTTSVTPSYSGGMLVLTVGIRASVTFSGQTAANAGAFTEPANADNASTAGTGAAVMQAYIANPALSASGAISWTPSGNGSSSVFVYELRPA